MPISTACHFLELILLWYCFPHRQCQYNSSLLHSRQNLKQSPCMKLIIYPSHLLISLKSVFLSFSLHLFPSLLSSHFFLLFPTLSRNSFTYIYIYIVVYCIIYCTNSIFLPLYHTFQIISLF